MKSPRSMAHAGFSLIELLVVIAIIGILAGLLLGGIQAVREGARRKRAEVDVQDIAHAVKAYRQEYGKLPLQTAKGADKTDKVDKELVDVLTAREDTPTENPRMITFMEPRPGALDTNTASATRGYYLDPWFRPYIISMDMNADGQVDLNMPAGGSTQIQNRVVGVMSGGRAPKDGRLEVYSWDL